MLLCIVGTTYGQGTLQYAQLGNFRLENGQIMNDCQVGYRVIGTLNPDKSNAVLFPTWFVGTSQDLISFIGPGKLIDSNRYFVIAVDAFGNGISSSPSNSKAQPDSAFPQFSIRDMVNAQYILLTQTLHLTRLYAVIGISMGAMQTFQWLVSYPDFLEKAIPIVGTPRLTPYGLLLWQTELRVIGAMNNGQQSDSLAMKIVADIHMLAQRTPHYFVTHTTPAEFPQFLTAAESAFMAYNLWNWASQVKAMLVHDIYKPFAGSVERAAMTISARVLVIVVRQDHMVNPEPARTLARVLDAEVMELKSDCGHIALWCGEDKIQDAATRFLAK